MQVLTRQRLHSLLNGHESPCVSLYQPTHRHHPDNQLDRVRYRQLLRTVEGNLRERYPGREVRDLVGRLHALADDALFWNKSRGGLAVLGTPATLEAFHLQRAVPELAVVADNFHVKPLLRYVQSADRYQVLCLTGKRARLFLGNRYFLDALDLNGTPAVSLVEALGEEVAEPPHSAGTFGRGASGPVRHHGHGAEQDSTALDTQRYFRVVDREVLAKFSRPSGLPLVLAALAEHQPVFRAISQNPHLLPRGVEGNPDALTPESLREQVWKAVEPQYLERLGRLCEDFRTALARQKGTADLSDAARATVEGRVATLLVEADRLVPGKMDPTTGAIQAGSAGEPGVDDLLDDLADAVLRRGGDVVVVPTGRMPSTTGLAVTYRY
jgi:hypothetical protein